jgi:hypothetical protein
MKRWERGSEKKGEKEGGGGRNNEKKGENM